jgi:hypothetical protein
MPSVHSNQRSKVTLGLEPLILKPRTLLALRSPKGEEGNPEPNEPRTFKPRTGFILQTPFLVGFQARLAGYQDWVIEFSDDERRCLNLLGIDSPGLTGSLAIARHV